MRGLVTIGAVLVVLLTSVGQASSDAPPMQALAVTPSVVSDGSATVTGDMSDSSTLQLNVGLGVRDSDALDALIAAASTPGSPDYGDYLTHDEYMADYAPTGDDVDAVRAWLTSQGLDVTTVSPDNLIVGVQGTVGAVEQAFGVSIDQYRADGVSFHSATSDPSVPATLDISSISGLDNLTKYTASGIDSIPYAGGAFGRDFRSGYNVTGNATGQTIGFTLWGEPVPQSDLTNYYNADVTATGSSFAAPELTIGTSGADTVDFETVDNSTPSTDTCVEDETAMDVETAHAMAPSSHLEYWLGYTTQPGDCTSDGASNSEMEDVLDAAATSTVSIISNSWGCNTSSPYDCPVDSTMESEL